MESVPLKVRIQKKQERFNRIRNPKGPDSGFGEFFLLIDITAITETLYIPISISSSKKPTGFVYQIEGTGKGTIATTNISCRGEGVTQVTLGTIVYSKIPPGKTATFHILIETRGQMAKEYKIVINRINYKRNPSDTRYQIFLQEISTSFVKFK